MFSLNIRLYLDTFTLFNFHSGFDGIDRSPNFKPNTVPAASGGENAFSQIGGLDELGSEYLQRQSIQQYRNIN